MFAHAHPVGADLPAVSLSNGVRPHGEWRCGWWWAGGMDGPRRFGRKPRRCFRADRRFGWRRRGTSPRRLAVAPLSLEIPALFPPDETPRPTLALAGPCRCAAMGGPRWGNRRAPAGVVRDRRIRADARSAPTTGMWRHGTGCASARPSFGLHTPGASHANPVGADLASARMANGGMGWWWDGWAAAFRGETPRPTLALAGPCRWRGNGRPARGEPRDARGGCAGQTHAGGHRSTGSRQAGPPLQRSWGGVGRARSGRTKVRPYNGHGRRTHPAYPCESCANDVGADLGPPAW